MSTVSIGPDGKVRVAQSKGERAKRRSEALVQQAGAAGHILTPAETPRHQWRTDLADPLLAFVVYGIPAPQGSKSFAGFRGKKPVLKEQSDALKPWRAAVRKMSQQAIRDWSGRTGRNWVALDEPVMVSAVVTVPATAAATKRADTYAMGTPDLDKLQRGIGDALAPTPLAPSDGKELGSGVAQKRAREALMQQRRALAVLHDDSRIVVWDHCVKVYPDTTPDSLAGYSGVMIRVWRLADLDASTRLPIRREAHGFTMAAGDIRRWARPASGETWEELAARLIADPEPLREGPVAVLGRTVDDDSARMLLHALLAHGPDHHLPVEVTA